MVKAMTDKKRNVPNLRFRGFTETWEQRKFSDIAQRISTNININLPNVTYDDIDSENETLNKGIKNLSSGKKGILFQKNDILFGKLRPYLNNIIKVDFKGIAVGDFWVLRAYEDSSFLFSLINTPQYKYIANISSGSKMPRSDWNLVSKYLFCIPSEKEQSHIGNLILKLSQLITLNQRKLEQLKLIKKALLQKMFADEKNPFPFIRFKGFTEAWEQRKLGTAIKIIKDKNKNQHSYRAFSISNIKGFIAQDEQFGKDNTYSKTDKSTNYIVKPGMFAYNPARINVGSIAYQNQTEPVLVSSLYEIFQTNSKIDDSFLMNWFKTSLFNRQIKRLEEGGVRQYFFIDKMKETEIKLPSISEQNQISKLLQLVNKNLDLHQRKLDQLQKLKKSLLQNMFI